MTNVTERLRTFFALSSSDRWLFIQAAVVQPLMPTGLRLLGFRRGQRALWRLTPAMGTPDASADASIQQVRHAARLVAAAGRPRCFGGSCLTRSMTLWWLLRRRRIPTRLCIGVRKRAGRLEAHAWLEHGQHVVNDDPRIRMQYAAFTPPGGDIARHTARDCNRPS